MDVPLNPVRNAVYASFFQLDNTHIKSSKVKVKKAAPKRKVAEDERWRGALGVSSHQPMIVNLEVS